MQIARALDTLEYANADGLSGSRPSVSEFGYVFVSLSFYREILNTSFWEILNDILRSRLFKIAAKNCTEKSHCL